MADSGGRSQLWPGRSARQLVLLVIVFGVAIDTLLLWASDGASNGDPVVAGWSVVKAAATFAILLWMSFRTREPAFVALALLVILVEADDIAGVTIRIGDWLVAATGVSAGPHAVNAQFAGRAAVGIVAGVPVVALVVGAEAWLRRVCVVMAAIFAVLFVVAVGVDAAFDFVGRNLDEALEEPITTLLTAFAAGCAVELGRRSPTVKLPRAAAHRRLSRSGRVR